MTVPVCPRCQRANPAGSVFCYFDGVALQAGVDGAAMRLIQEFAFPSGRRCRTFDELAQGCQEEWPAARDLLRQGVFHRYFSGIGRHDLARAAQESQAITNGDIGLTRFVGALPATRLPEAKIDIHPRRIAPGPVPAGEQRQFQLVINNLGPATLQGTITVSDGADWIKLDGGNSQCAVKTTREQRIALTINTQGLEAAQSYLGKLTVVTNGGIVEVPVGMDLVAQPYPRPPFQGAKTPRELAEKMRVQPKAAGPALEAGEVQRWFAANNWKYPVIGTPAKGVAGVQQFFEAMGLSKPPKVQLSQSEVRIVGQYPQTMRFQVSLQTTARKWVYAQATSDSPWLKVLNPQIGGPQKATLGLEIDTETLPGAQAEGNVQVLANAGQKLKLRVHAQAQGLPGRMPTGWLGPLVAAGLAFFLVRLTLVPIVDLGGRAAAVEAAARRLERPLSADSPLRKVGGWLPLPWTSILAGTEAPIPSTVFNPQSTGEVSAREFRHYYASYLIRNLILWTWWLGAVAGGFVMWRQGGPGDVAWGIVAGAVAGAMVSATVACLFLVLEIVPHFLASLVLSATASGVAAWLVWVVLALLGWTAIGVAGAALLALVPPLRTGLLAPLQRGIAGLCRVCRLHALERLCMGE
jgi:hypothetical protein